MTLLSRIIFICIFSLGFFNPEQLIACTGLMLTAKDKSFVHGRTLEFGMQVDTSIAIVPRNYAFEATTPLGKGLTYQSKYGAIGAVAFNDPALLDGMNETGLSIGTFYFPGFAGYATTTSENQKSSLSPADFPNWILTQFKTVEEVKAAVKNVNIVPTILKGWGDDVPPFHYIVYDSSGKSIVIEPIDGQLVVHENPIGVLTNSPQFEWHMLNLRNYINLSTFNAKPLKINDLELKSFGQGSGMVGMPGDFTPPSRFVRAAIYSATAIPVETSEMAVFQAFHILNQFDIPVGVIREESNGKIYTDSTLMTCVRDPKNLNYYFRTYEDQTIKVVNFKKFDLNSKSIVKAKINGNGTAVDITSTIK